MIELSDAYLRQVAFRAGVEEFWHEDCIQEMRLEMSKVPDELKKIAAKRRAINFHRYLTHSRHNDEIRPIFTPLESITPISQHRPPLEELMDLSDKLAKLPERQARIVLLRAYGYSAREIAEKFELSQTRIVQLLAEANLSLREPLRDATLNCPESA